MKGGMMKKTQKKSAKTKAGKVKVGKIKMAAAPGRKALICGMLERGDRMLFLIRKDAKGYERVEMPCVYGTTKADFVGQLAEAYKKQTNVKVVTGKLRIEGKHNVGTGAKPEYIPVLVFEMSPQDPLVRPDAGKGIERCEWMTVMEAKNRQLTDDGMWLLEDTEIVEP
jgi:hypothetical protein